MKLRINRALVLTLKRKYMEDKRIPKKTWQEIVKNVIKAAIIALLKGIGVLRK